MKWPWKRKPKLWTVRGVAGGLQYTKAGMEVLRQKYLEHYERTHRPR